ncbi:UDP-N-acetylmuramoyl-L-alanyl-D-glutamate--2,6-diaminopimelate ligase [Desulfovibrio sp. OttesenSCG-928-C06]|nr:UDP-N-acetylmuramoyl-L-alanyl-D-glutamate--2,6-diaminopimelate ligase [Desulfovibrio sp. OttesenSCG-928-C06]
MSILEMNLESALELVRGGISKATSNMPARKVASHSGKVGKGDVFVILPPLPGATSGGLDFLPDALKAGAAVVVCQDNMAAGAAELMRAALTVHGNGPASAAGEELFICAVPDVRVALGQLAAAYYETENYRPLLAGITGTNGKTTSTYLLEALFRGAGHRVGVIGTIAYSWPGYSIPAPLTTPGCIELHELLSSMKDYNVDTVFMEVSSHALEQNRIAGLNFDGALFTNLSQDHLDYHKDMESYFQAKARFFREPDAGGAEKSGKARAINVNDWHGMKLFEECANLPGGAVAFGLAEKLNPAQFAPGRLLEGKIMDIGPAGLRLKQRLAGREWEISSPLVGEFNAYNLLGVQALALSLGMGVEDLKLLETMNGVPGRLERVASTDVNPAAPRLDAFVDYSHTPDSLEKAIIALRDTGFERVITVFGCGGDRDRSKRPIMGEAACKYSDVAVLTSDNPRTEDPQAIMNDVLPGVKGCAEFYQEADRKKATELAVSLMQPGDALLVAGKGHEDYQIIGKEKTHYSDQEVLREIFSKL